MSDDFHSVELMNESDGIGVRLVFRLERCDSCGEHVRYWNDAGEGNAAWACGCTVWGAEGCACVALPSQVPGLVDRAAVAIRSLDGYDEVRREMEGWLTLVENPEVRDHARILVEWSVQAATSPEPATVLFAMAIRCGVRALGMGSELTVAERVPLELLANSQVDLKSWVTILGAEPRVGAVRALLAALDARERGSLLGGFRNRPMAAADLIFELCAVSASAAVMVEGKRWSGAPGASDLLPGGSWPAVSVDSGSFVGNSATPWVKVCGSDAWVYVPSVGRRSAGSPPLTEGDRGSAGSVLRDAHRDLMAELAARCEEPFDDDQDPALDTPDQRLIRAFQRWRALGGDGLRTSCVVCGAVGNGNATCWSCVAHWTWMGPEERKNLLGILLGRQPAAPCGPREVEAFVSRLSGSGAAGAELVALDKKAERVAAHLRARVGGARHAFAEALEHAARALRSPPPGPPGIDDFHRKVLVGHVARHGRHRELAAELLRAVGEDADRPVESAEAPVGAAAPRAAGPIVLSLSQQLTLLDWDSELYLTGGEASVGMFPGRVYSLREVSAAVGAAVRAACGAPDSLVGEDRVMLNGWLASPPVETSALVLSSLQSLFHILAAGHVGPDGRPPVPRPTRVHVAALEQMIATSPGSDLLSELTQHRNFVVGVSVSDRKIRRELEIRRVITDPGTPSIDRAALILLVSAPDRLDEYGYPCEFSWWARVQVQRLPLARVISAALDVVGLDELVAEDVHVLCEERWRVPRRFREAVERLLDDLEAGARHRKEWFDLLGAARAIRSGRVIVEDLRPMATRRLAEALDAVVRIAVLRQMGHPVAAQEDDVAILRGLLSSEFTGDARAIPERVASLLSSSGVAGSYGS